MFQRFQYQVVAHRQEKQPQLVVLEGRLLPTQQRSWLPRMMPRTCSILVYLSLLVFAWTVALEQSLRLQIVQIRPRIAHLFYFHLECLTNMPNWHNPAQMAVAAPGLLILVALPPWEMWASEPGWPDHWCWAQR